MTVSREADGPSWVGCRTPSRVALAGPLERAEAHADLTAEAPLPWGLRGKALTCEILVLRASQFSHTWDRVWNAFALTWLAEDKPRQSLTEAAQLQGDTRPVGVAPHHLIQPVPDDLPFGAERTTPRRTGHRAGCLERPRVAGKLDQIAFDRRA